ncbi:MAG: hypothetical protein WHT08_09770 [Bryobacteraceae bacterium]
MVALRLRIAAAVLSVFAFLPLLGLPAPPLPDTPPRLEWLARPGAAALLWLLHSAAPPPWSAPALALGLHAAASVLLAFLLPALFTPRATHLAVLLYALHPLHADSLALPELAATLPGAVLALGSAQAFLRSRTRAGTVLALAALLFDPAAAAIPPVLFLLAGRAAGGRRLLWLGIAGAAAWLAALRPVWHQAAAEWPSLGIFALRTVFLALFPLGLTPWPDLRGAPLESALAAAAVAAAAWIAWTAGRRHALGAWLLSAVLLLASVWFLPAAEGARSLALPLIALCAFLALMLEHADVRLSAVYLAALALLSFNYSRLWQDPVALGMEAVRLAPRLPAPALALVPHLPAPQALELITEARRHAPSDPRLPLAAGRALLRAQRAQEALAEFDTALSLDPRSHAAHTGRALAWLALGRSEEALAELARALALEPCSLEARLALALLGGAPPPDSGCLWTRAQRRALAGAISRR